MFSTNDDWDFKDIRTHCLVSLCDIVCFLQSNSLLKYMLEYVKSAYALYKLIYHLKQLCGWSTSGYVSSFLETGMIKSELLCCLKRYGTCCSLLWFSILHKNIKQLLGSVLGCWTNFFQDRMMATDQLKDFINKHAYLCSIELLSVIYVGSIFSMWLRFYLTCGHYVMNILII